MNDPRAGYVLPSWTSRSPCTTRSASWSRACARCTRYVDAAHSLRDADHHRRQRERGRDTRLIGMRLARRARRRALRPSCREGSRPGAPRRMDGERCARARVHGRRPLDTTRVADGADRADPLGRQRHQHRQPARTPVRGSPGACERELISRGYNLLLRAVLHTRFRDAQCGFKAIRAAGCARPGARWFVTRDGSSTPSCSCSRSVPALRIHEVPVEWVEDPDSRVNIPRTVLTDLRGVLRMLRTTPHSRSRYARRRLRHPQEIR